jgi:DnaJ-class molecular chaperone
MAALDLILLAAALAGAGAYLVSLRVHPWWPCRSCKGSGKTRDRLWKQARGTCARCGGKGQRPRKGIKVLNPARYERMRQQATGRKRADERGN